MRRILTIIVSAFLAINLNAQSFLKGDIDNDGIVNITDVVILVDYILDDFINPIPRGDLNNDGVVNITDAVILVDRILDDIPIMQIYPSCPDDNHPHAIDLGLPSGTVWSCCNLDATSPMEIGGYFGWGESETKTTFSHHNYQHIDNKSGKFKNIEDDICGTEYDVAFMKWGGYWRMPSKEQIYELVKNCYFSWCSDAGIPGGKFTSKVNGSSIFLPATGFYMNSKLKDAHGGGYYWSGTKRPDNDYDAFILCFGYVNANGYNCVTERQHGLSIRPIAK